MVWLWRVLRAAFRGPVRRAPWDDLDDEDRAYLRGWHKN